MFLIFQCSDSEFKFAEEMDDCCSAGIWVSLLLAFHGDETILLLSIV